LADFRVNNNNEQMLESVVIVGAGQAAAQLIASLAQDGFAGSVTLVGDEPYLPYQRPPLSKKYLAGELALDRLYVKPTAFYEKVGTRLRLGIKVERLDRPDKAVVLADGSRLPYSTLVLATGSRARPLPLPGTDRDGVYFLRTIADVEALRARFAPGKALVVVGGGYIGLELAAVAAKLGLRVTVLEQAPRVMGRGVGPVVSRFYERLHREEGVDIRTGVAVRGIEAGSVLCDDGSHAADLVLIGAGAVPNVELAREAGLAVEDGITVDAQCRTSDPAIYAIGDCTVQHHALFDRRLRLESVHNALEQGRLAAASICNRPPPVLQVPWFWSDQYDVKLQMVGLSAGHDEAVVRGDPETSRSFAVFYLRHGILLAVDAVNRAPEFMMSKQLIAERARPDPARLRDERVAVKELKG
jgi:3-phenylpropionate/trans-cinnamate dioxygenase ferredoxin reductase component